ncbi:MAG: biotin transporter BioY [Lachnospiraceae bacterium]|nr:biotin transporter BioY [Lachnospiraceae bacterium]
MNAKTKVLTQIALITAVICILGPLTLPIGPVPISLAPLAIFLGVYILGCVKGTVAVLLYLLIGLIGVPVFSNFSGGAGKLFGPTGGYLIGYIFTALVAGFIVERFYRNVILQALGMILGLAILYLVGTVWLANQAGMTLSAAAAAGVWPFVILDLLKIAAAILLGRAVRAGLIRAGLIETNRTQAA